MDGFIISGPKVYSRNETLKNGYIKVKRGLIEEVGSHFVKNSFESSFSVVEYPEDYLVVPGVISLVSEPLLGRVTQLKIEKVSRKMGVEGVTGFLVNLPYKRGNFFELCKNVEIVRDFMIEGSSIEGAEVLGLHLVSEEAVDEIEFLQEKAKGALKRITLPSNDISEKNIVDAEKNGVSLSVAQAGLSMKRAKNEENFPQTLPPMEFKYFLRNKSGGIYEKVNAQNVLEDAESVEDEILRNLIEINTVKPLFELGETTFKGGIYPRMEADLVVLDKSLEVVSSFSRGYQVHGHFN